MVDLKDALQEASVPSGDWRASLRDFMIALVVFGGLFGGVAVDNGNASPMPPPPELSAVAPSAEGSAAAEPVAFKVQPPSIADAPGAAGNDRYTLLIMMTLALASLVAFNTTVWRHLRRSYAEPRQH